MNYQAEGTFLILDIPYEAKFSKGFKNEVIELPSLKIAGLPLTVLSAGSQVDNIKVGDRVLLFQDSVETIILDTVKYILIQSFDIAIRMKRDDEQDNKPTSVNIEQALEEIK